MPFHLGTQFVSAPLNRVRCFRLSHVLVHVIVQHLPVESVPDIGLVEIEVKLALRACLSSTLFCFLALIRSSILFRSAASFASRSRSDAAVPIPARTLLLNPLTAFLKPPGYPSSYGGQSVEWSTNQQPIDAADHRQHGSRQAKRHASDEHPANQDEEERAGFAWVKMRDAQDCVRDKGRVPDASTPEQVELIAFGDLAPDEEQQPRDEQRRKEIVVLKPIEKNVHSASPSGMYSGS